MQTENSRIWAREQFHGVQLGDERRAARLHTMAARAAEHPAGTVSEVFVDDAEREGAFRFLENPTISADALARANHAATAAECAQLPYVFVPVDGTSLHLTEATRSKGFGHIGSLTAGARGLKVINALAIAPDGTPIGMCAQVWWARAGRTRYSKKWTERVQYWKRETGCWIDAIFDVVEQFREHAPSTRPWFQLDREGDSWPVLEHACEYGLWVTVRASNDRRLETDDRGRKRYLWRTLESQPVLALYSLPIPQRVDRKARVASIEVRARPVTLDLQVGTRCYYKARVWAVLAREKGRRSADRIEWMLLTTHPVNSISDALEVIYGYAQRWRIEELHRAWKSGACNVEDTQLRSRAAVIKWATILVAVAARAIRLTYLARKSPTLPANQEFSQYEIDAVLILKKSKTYRRGDVPSLGELVRWVADLGGYTGKSSGGPPGARVIARGLNRVLNLAEGLKNMDEM